MSERVLDNFLFSPPFRIRMPNGDIGPRYGPSPSAFRKHMSLSKNWAWRPDTEKQKDIEFLRRAITAGKASPREEQIFGLVYGANTSVCSAAKFLGISRGTVRMHLERLHRKARECEKDE